MGLHTRISPFKTSWIPPLKRQTNKQTYQFRRSQDSFSCLNVCLSNENIRLTAHAGCIQSSSRRSTDHEPGRNFHRSGCNPDISEGPRQKSSPRSPPLIFSKQRETQAWTINIDPPGLCTDQNRGGERSNHTRDLNRWKRFKIWLAWEEHGGPLNSWCSRLAPQTNEDEGGWSD